MQASEKYLMGNENVFVGNITSKGIKSLGKVQVFDISMYNGKDIPPFFVQVKVFNNTETPGKYSAKDRVRVYGSLRLNKWGENNERQTIVVNANKLELAPWEGGGKETPKENFTSGFDEDEIKF